ncbi:hypothetical protein DL771_001606 [Monosporascus sp. 5C6A]|nr:hypothetical protein DL771_001606 [Monosporascus sp. 5C6A]
MTESQWHIVMVTNSPLNGFHYDGSTGLLTAARGPGDSTSQAMTTTSLYCIPWFQVTDESSVTISEIKSELQMSMATNAFSSWSVEAAASGGIGGIMGGFSALGSLSASSSGSSKGKAEGCAAHVFPRVAVYFDAHDLELSDACSALLETIKTNKNAVRRPTAQHAGREHAVREQHEREEGRHEAGGWRQLSSPFGSGSQNGQSSTHGQEALTGEAQGGETLLGSNPASWIASVGSFYNWRVMQRDGLRDILRLMQEATPFDWPATFDAILNRKSDKKDDGNIDDGGGGTRGSGGGDGGGDGADYCCQACGQRMPSI